MADKELPVEMELTDDNPGPLTKDIGDTQEIVGVSSKGWSSFHVSQRC